MKLIGWAAVTGWSISLMHLNNKNLIDLNKGTLNGLTMIFYDDSQSVESN